LFRTLSRSGLAMSTFAREGGARHESDSMNCGYAHIISLAAAADRALQIPTRCDVSDRAVGFDEDRRGDRRGKLRIAVDQNRVGMEKDACRRSAMRLVAATKTQDMARKSFAKGTAA